MSTFLWRTRSPRSGIPIWFSERGNNILDGGTHFYQVEERESLFLDIFQMMFGYYYSTLLSIEAIFKFIFNISIQFQFLIVVLRLREHECQFNLHLENTELSRGIATRYCSADICDFGWEIRRCRSAGTPVLCGVHSRHWIGSGGISTNAGYGGSESRSERNFQNENSGRVGSNFPEHRRLCNTRSGF